MEIRTIDDFLEFLKSQTRIMSNLIYRGVRNSEFKLIPSIGRLKTHSGTQLDVNAEKELFDSFKNRAYPFIRGHNYDDLDLLALGRNYGLPTRLLDWTKNPMVAAYFAVEEPFTKDDEKQTNFAVYIFIRGKHQ
jgi:hypothetical protein